MLYKILRSHENVALVMEYKKIFRLKEMLEKAGIPFIFKELNDGYQILYKNDSRETKCSVIEHEFSYGHEEDLLEIMGLLTDEESKDGSVLGFLTAENVFKRIKNHWKKVEQNNS